METRYSGLKRNTNTLKHKYTLRNQEWFRIFTDSIREGSKDAAMGSGELSPEQLASFVTYKAPHVYFVPTHAVRQNFPAWVHALGAEVACLMVARNPKLFLEHFETITDNAQSIAQQVGHRQVAAYYLTREPALIRRAPNDRVKAWQAVLDVVGDKDVVKWCFQQSFLPRFIEVSGRASYGSRYQGRYTRVDGAQENLKVVISVFDTQ